MTAADVKKLLAARAKNAAKRGLKGKDKDKYIHAGGMGKKKVLTTASYKPSHAKEKAKFKADIVSSLESKKAALKAKETKKADYGRRTAPTITEPAKEAVTPAVTTYKPAEKAEGLENTWEVMKIAVNPFSKERIKVDPNIINNVIIRNGLEAAANNPYTTALIITGVLGLGKAALAKAGVGTGRIVVGKAAETTGYTGSAAVWRGGSTISTSVSTYAANTKTAAMSSKFLVKAGFSVAAILAIKDAIGTYPFAKFEISETMQTLGMARWKAFEAGNTDLMDDLDALQDEVLNPTGWENILSKIPWANVHTAAKQNIEAAEASRKVFNKIMEDKITAKENGEPEDEKWDRIKQEQADQDKAAIDYYNSERKKLVSWEKEAQAAARAAKRSDEIKARNEDAAFWAKQAAKQKELEAADRKAIADFWAAYRKQMQKISEDSRPSKLNFGIL